MSKKGHEGIADALIGDDFISSFLHNTNPAFALGGSDFERHVASPQARVASLDEVALIGAKAEEEEVAQAFFRADPVIVRIHGADEVIVPHPGVKSPSEAGESFFP